MRGLRTVVIAGLGAGIGVVAFAQVTRGPGVRFINPPGLRASTSYTHVVEVAAGRTVYIAGQVALDADGNLVGAGDLRAQARQAFDNLKTALASVGAGFEDVVKTTTYVTDMSELDTLREVRRDYLAEPPPTSTLVQVVRLARAGFLLEIEAIAVRPQ